MFNHTKKHTSFGLFDCKPVMEQCQDVMEMTHGSHCRGLIMTLSSELTVEQLRELIDGSNTGLVTIGDRHESIGKFHATVFLHHEQEKPWSVTVCTEDLYRITCWRKTIYEAYAFVAGIRSGDIEYKEPAEDADMRSMYMQQWEKFCDG